MILKISTHERGSARYRQIFSKMKKMSMDPKFVTCIRVKVPETRIFSISTIASVFDVLSPLFVDQVCDQFGPLDDATVFWESDGRLTGPRTLHLGAHMVIAVIYGQAETLILHCEQDESGRCVVQDRVYQPNKRNKEVLNIVFSGKYDNVAFPRVVYKVFEAVEAILSKGHLEDNTNYGKTFVKP